MLIEIQIIEQILTRVATRCILCNAPACVGYISPLCKGRSGLGRRIIAAKRRKRATATSGWWKPKGIVRLFLAVISVRENLHRRANLAVHAH